MLHRSSSILVKVLGNDLVWHWFCHVCIYIYIYIFFFCSLSNLVEKIRSAVRYSTYVSFLMYSCRVVSNTCRAGYLSIVVVSLVFQLQAIFVSEALTVWRDTTMIKNQEWGKKEIFSLKWWRFELRGMKGRIKERRKRKWEKKEKTKDSARDNGERPRYSTRRAIHVAALLTRKLVGLTVGLPVSVRCILIPLARTFFCRCARVQCILPTFCFTVQPYILILRTYRSAYYVPTLWYTAQANFSPIQLNVSSPYVCVLLAVLCRLDAWFFPQSLTRSLNVFCSPTPFPLPPLFVTSLTLLQFQFPFRGRCLRLSRDIGQEKTTMDSCRVVDR